MTCTLALAQVLPLGFTQAIFFLCCCTLSGIGVVFLTSPEPSFAVLVKLWMVSCFIPFCVWDNWPFCMCFCHKMTVYLLGGYDHSVCYTSAQLTEGRSARDQPKQPPAKKKKCGVVNCFMERYYGKIDWFAFWFWG